MDLTWWCEIFVYGGVLVHNIRFTFGGGRSSKFAACAVQVFQRYDFESGSTANSPSAVSSVSIHLLLQCTKF
jgi:hypothetical protein